MDYKSLMGYGKKSKKVIKEQPKPKKTVLDGIKKDLLKESYVWERKFGEKLPTLTDVQKKKLNEVGIAPELKMYTHAINKNYDRYWKSVKELQKYLTKKGAGKLSKEMGSIYVGNVGKFHNWLKTKFIRMIRKYI